MVGRPLLTAHRSLREYGTLEQPTKIKFDGTPKAWPAFKEAMLKMADAQGFVYMLEGGHGCDNGLCAIFQAASGVTVALFY